MPSICDRFNEFKDLLYLKREKKQKLIELILIVGSILIALKTPETLTGDIIILKDNNITVLFMLLLFCSVLYFILIQKEIQDNKKKFVSLLVVVIAIIFSAIMSSFLAISLAKNFQTPSFKIVSYLVILFAYWIPLTLVIWGALKEK